MNWQEYQEAVARLYEQAQGIGRVKRNVFVRDRITGQPRQIDVLIEIEARDQVIRTVVDAKFKRRKVDVRDVEGVLALSTAIGATKTVIVAANGWTGPAGTKCRFSDADLRLLTVDEALDLVVEDKWELCPGCENDCIVLDQDGLIELDGLYTIFLAGQCRECRLARVWCWDCGQQSYLASGISQSCNCGHTWRCTEKGVLLRVAGTRQFQPVSSFLQAEPER